MAAAYHLESDMVQERNRHASGSESEGFCEVRRRGSDACEQAEADLIEAGLSEHAGRVGAKGNVERSRCGGRRQVDDAASGAGLAKRARGRCRWHDRREDPRA